MRKWESNLGMDPFSYGYNRATPISAYITPSEIVTSLIDIVSKNGNFLLDIGPQANGTIVDIEKKNLREAGQWIKGHGEAIFNTTYWFVTPEEGDTVRFTQTPDAFYILTLYSPNATLMLDSPVPYVAGDQVTVVGGNMSGSVVPSRLLSNGSLELTISDAVAAADQYSWVFKIAFGGVSANGTATGSAPPVQQTTNGGGRWSPDWIMMVPSVVLGAALWLM
jgi:alpha-L-fucosidase